MHSLKSMLMLPEGTLPNHIAAKQTCYGKKKKRKKKRFKKVKVVFKTGWGSIALSIKKTQNRKILIPMYQVSVSIVR